MTDVAQIAQKLDRALCADCRESLSIAIYESGPKIWCGECGREYAVEYEEIEGSDDVRFSVPDALDARKMPA